LEDLLLQARAELDKNGHQLKSWAMPK
jgi:hypothetical protein